MESRYTLPVQTQWLQAGEAARRLGITPQGLRDRARAGRIPYQRTSAGAFLFAATDVEAALSAPGRAVVDVEWPAVLVPDREWQRLDGWDGAERGGWVFGRNLGDRLVVEAVDDEPEAVRTARTISLDVIRALEVERVEAPGVTVIGDWHGHPPGASHFASSADLAAWRSTAARLQRTWLSLIVTEPTGRSQIEADVVGYLTKPDGEHKWIIPVRLEAR